jgi:nucleolar protein 15
MRAYFSQFGDITRLRLSRNRVTGRSKHFAFVEFASVSVAKIVAETMDNYLLYGHILKCKFVSEDQLHPGIWKGANRRFKKVPWNKIEKKRLEQGKTREQWDQSIKKEQQRRIGQALKAEALGYHLDLPELKMTSEIPSQVKETEAIDASSEEPTIEPAKVLEAFAKDQDEKGHNGFDKQSAQPSKGEKRDRTAFSAATSGNDKPKEGVIAMVPEGELAREATTSTSSKQNNKAKKAKKKKKAKNAQK